MTHLIEQWQPECLSNSCQLHGLMFTSCPFHSFLLWYVTRPLFYPGKYHVPGLIQGLTPWMWANPGLRPSFLFQVIHIVSRSLPSPISSTSEPFPRLLPYPITHNPSMIFPLYLFRVSPIPAECRQYSWDNGRLTGWLASAGNREYVPFLQRTAASPRHLSAAFFIREIKVWRTNEQWEGRSEQWLLLLWYSASFFYSLSLV